VSGQIQYGHDWGFVCRDVRFKPVGVDSHLSVVVLKFKLNIVRTDKLRDFVGATPFGGQLLILVQEEMFI
jgi:hypothetical protein